jgi:hypothetical protein
MDELNTGALILLDRARKCLTPQQYKTIRGQILAGNADGGLRGLEKIMRRRRKSRDHTARQSSGNSNRDQSQDEDLEK